MFRAFVIASLFVASAALAQPDLHVTISAANPARDKEPFTFRIFVDNTGTEAATNVTLDSGSQFEKCHANTPIGTIAPGVTHVFSCTVHVMMLDVPNRYSFEVYASVDSESEPVLNRSDNLSRLDLPIITPLPDLTIGQHGLTPMATPGLPVKVTLGYRNIANVEASGATVIVTTPTEFLSFPPGCSNEGDRVVCDLPLIPGGFDNVYPLELVVVAPNISEHRFAVTAEIHADEGDYDPSNDSGEATGATYRTFFVTNVADSGSGSLRAAIETANASCADYWPCEIAFRIDSPAAWNTIRVESPLPAITGSAVVIDGETQTKSFGDTNPDGPEIEIRGTEGAEDGLVLATTCSATLDGVVINGFRGNGVTLHGAVGSCFFPIRVLERNYIGTDPTGMQAIPNGRGIVIDAEPRWTMQHNLVSGNERSGIYIFRGQCLVRYNTIGLNRTRSAGLGNGASGVAIFPGGSGTDVDNNYIGFNRHFGIGIVPLAHSIGINGNSIQADGQGGIDWGIDGVTESPELPVILDARFENGQTIIEGIAPDANGQVNVYANDAPDPSGYGEGQYFLGIAGALAGHFRFVHIGDLRGKWIAATFTRVQLFGLLQENARESWFATNTSEFGRSVEVRDPTGQ